MAQRSTSKPKKRVTFSTEAMYQFWAQAGGKVSVAMLLAKEANEKRVPKDPHTWARYATKHKFEERWQKEEDERWKKFHEERERNQQKVMDRVASTFEKVAEYVAVTFEEDLDQLMKLDRESRKAKNIVKRLEKFFGSVDGFDRFYRMYLRSRGLPERMTQERLTHEGSVPVTYGDIEDDAPTPEEAAKKAKKAGF